MGSCHSHPNIDINIRTLGDSLTDSGYFGQVMDYNSDHTKWYQYWIYEQLRSRNIESSILDLGIGGETTLQVCDRILSATPASYITILAGTNDILQGDYNDPDINEKLATRIIELYRDCVPKAIEHQIKTVGSTPTIVVCTIPPLSKDCETQLPIEMMTHAIDYVNNKLASFINDWIEYENIVLLCDTNRWLRGNESYSIPGLYIKDGIHFNEQGQAVCGQAIAQTIIEHYYKW